LKRIFIAALAVLLVVPFMVQADFGDTLAAVQGRGALNCGVNGQLPGFSGLDANGNIEGFDADYCRAIAAAVLGDGEAVGFVPLTAPQRFDALAAGDIDVLIRNTTWTVSRDTDLGNNFVHTTFYDGQGFMVRNDSGISSVAELDGASICVGTGTTTELNLADTFAARGLSFTPVVFENTDETFNAYDSGRCDAVTTDISGLASRRGTLADPSAHTVLAEAISKEPLGPLVRHGDDQWFDIVQWTVFATFFAEEAGITAGNVGGFDRSDPEVDRFLGEISTKFGLDAGAFANAIAAVGNYGEIYDRNVTPIGVAREGGQNASFQNGGLLYSPPFR
jgi:general L-amino acid transport system substrate-binding protein